MDDFFLRNAFLVAAAVWAEEVAQEEAECVAQQLQVAAHGREGHGAVDALFDVAVVGMLVGAEDSSLDAWWKEAVDDGPPLLVAAGDGPAVGRDAAHLEDGDDDADVAVRTPAHEPMVEQEGPVGHDAEVLVVGRLAQQGRAGERCLVHERAFEQEAGCHAAGREAAFGRAPAGDEVVACDEISPFEPGDGMCEHVRGGECVAGVEEEDIFTTGQADALVHGVVDACVGFADPAGDAGRGSDEFAAAVGRAAVDDDIFKVAGRLRRDGLDGASEFVDVVEADGDDGEFHCSSFVSFRVCTVLQK